MSELTGGGTYGRELLLGLGGVVALYLIQLRNYLLFHSLVELFSILVAFAVFIVAWNTRAELENPFLAVLGVSYLFIGGIDLLHTLAYKGMGVFPEMGADLPTQLWIFGRYLEAFSLLGAGAIGVRANAGDGLAHDWSERTLPAVAVGYALVVAAGLGSIFVLEVFPRAFVEGSGLTPFKIVSEYVIVGLLGVALAVLYRQREAFDRRVFRFLVAAVVLTMGAELAFTVYVDVYGISNAVGHFLKVGSFYLIYLAVVKTGITEPQKNLYHTLAQREAEARKFEQAVEHSGHAVVITDRGGTIQYVNPAYEEMTGYSSAELVGRNPRILQSGEHEGPFYEELWSTILSGEIWENEIVNVRKDGERFVGNQTIAPIVDEEGEIRHFVGVHMDISERKRQEQELLKRYESLFDSIRDAIVVTDTDRRVTNANPAFTDLFGYEPAEVVGRHTQELYESDEEFERVGEKLRTHAGESRVTYTASYRKKTGQVFPGETTVFHLRNADDEVVGLIGLVRDVSDRENRIHQLQILDRILRHNIRNEMNVIEGHATVIRESAPEEFADDAEGILGTVEKLMETVSKEREITTFLSEPQSAESIDLCSTLEAVLEDVRERHPNADITVSVPKGCSVRAIPSISRAVTEVLENAIVHSDRTTPEVTVRVERGDDVVTLEVADDGPGIPQMEQRVLTGREKIDALYHGSGLGLWLVTLIVQQSDGVLTLEDNEPRGSVVTIQLPID